MSSWTDYNSCFAKFFIQNVWGRGPCWRCHSYIFEITTFHTWAWGVGGGSYPPSRPPYPPIQKSSYHISPPYLRGFPKIFGNKNAIISENSPRKIDPPFRNFGLCSKDLPPWKKSHAHVWFYSIIMILGQNNLAMCRLF